jgi:hypothetical protein
LKGDDDLRFLQLLGQPSIRPFHLRDLLDQYAIRIGLPSPLARQSRHSFLLPLPPPRDQMRRVQTFTPQQRTDLARLLAPLGLSQDPCLVLGRESPPLRTSLHFGIRNFHNLFARHRLSLTPP